MPIELEAACVSIQLAHLYEQQGFGAAIDFPLWICCSK